MYGFQHNFRQLITIFHRVIYLVIIDVENDYSIVDKQITKSLKPVMSNSRENNEFICIVL